MSQASISHLFIYRYEERFRSLTNSLNHNRHLVVPIDKLLGPQYPPELKWIVHHTMLYYA
jgi:hypothetical protein